MMSEGQNKLKKEVAKAAGHRVMPFGIPFYAGGGIFLGFVLLSSVSWLAAIGLGFAAYVLIRGALHLEPHPVRAFLLWLRYGRFAYDAGARNFLKLQGKKSLWA
jgi:hypothetical protein